jgi:hypothetical protein
MLASFLSSSIYILFYNSGCHLLSNYYIPAGGSKLVYFINDVLQPCLLLYLFSVAAFSTIVELNSWNEIIPLQSFTYLLFYI